MRRLFLTILGALAAPALAAEPPKLDLMLSPHATGGADSYLGVRMVLDQPGLKAGEGLVRLPLSLVGIPTPRYDGKALTARDDQGPLPLTQSEEPPTPQGVYRRWSVGRASVGDVVVSYRAPPRKVTAATNNGPLFDLREEAGGFAGSGNGFLATPVRPGPWQVHLAWDLTAAPAGARGVWSLGEGAVDTVVPAEVLAFSYYYVGPVRSYPTDPKAPFGFYWLSDPPFDANLLGERMKALYGAMSGFFGDAVSRYRVFVRQNPYSGTGGTGLAQSFMFGYNAAAKPTADSLQGLLAHEMAHTWPAMQGEHGDTAWYSEGAAEHYSTVLSFRAGAISVDRLLKTFNERADAYYSNPYIAASNPEAAQKFWTDPIAQTVPYGRGWLYLQQTDATIREASQGRRGLDDIVKALRRRQVAGEPRGIPEWLELVGQEIGADAAKARYHHMVSGGLLKPPANLYAPCLIVVSHPIRQFQLGFARASLNDERIVRGVVAGSAAAQAGMRDGDAIVEVSDVAKARADEAQTLTLTLRRGESRTTVTYLPRGAVVEGYRWARDPKVPDAACRF